MDYSVGSVAALLSGNVTPNRPRVIKRALTPIKHEQSPNVTPKSELVNDRSIFLSPSVQKKKAIVKKSPKRIFDNPELDLTNDGEGTPNVLSPKADRVKKHLQDDLEADQTAKTILKSPKSHKKVKGNLEKSLEEETSKNTIKTSKIGETVETDVQSANESTPKKKKKQRNLIAQPVDEEKENITEHIAETDVVVKSPKTSKKRKSTELTTDDVSTKVTGDEDNESPKKKRKQKKSESEENTLDMHTVQNNESKKKKNKKKKSPVETVNQEESTKKNKKVKSQKKKNKQHVTVNPNAITNKDSDSEHDSDDEIESENEQINNKVLDTGPNELESSDEEEDLKTKTRTPEKRDNLQERNIEDEIKRTLFVGNVPFSKKCKKEVRSIFVKHGPIESVRIRTVPVKDGRVTPKLAVIKNELHPERSTVNVYIKFKQPDSIGKALSENNTVLNGHHLRVSRSEVTGTEHDPRRAIFVGNMPFNIEDDVLRAQFESCGEIESVRVIRDRTTNAGKGFGYVNFASKDGVELALAMSEEDLTIRNRILRVKRCTMTMGKRDQGRSEKPGKHPGPNTRGPPGRHGPPGRFQGPQRPQGPPRSQGPSRSQGPRKSQGVRGRNQPPGRFQGPQGKLDGGKQVQDGAHRRILKKRGNEESGGVSGVSPPPHEPPLAAPRDKKPRKEFVGVTAEKKKKRKFDKGQKKKKALSEILAKK